MAKRPFRLLDRLRWPVLLPGDIRGVVIAIFLVVAALLVMFWLRPSQLGVNYGFGPEWDCADASGGWGGRALNCIKRPPPK